MPTPEQIRYQATVAPIIANKDAATYMAAPPDASEFSASGGPPQEGAAPEDMESSQEDIQEGGEETEEEEEYSEGEDNPFLDDGSEFAEGGDIVDDDSGDLLPDDDSGERHSRRSAPKRVSRPLPPASMGGMR